MNEAAGDFLLLDRESCHRLGGFNERVRFTEDPQGLAVLPAGASPRAGHRVARAGLPHRSRRLVRQHQAHLSARASPTRPSGRTGPAGSRIWNREDWGVRGAIEEPHGATTWLRTPEEAGPVADAGAARSAAMPLRARRPSTRCSRPPAPSSCWSSIPMPALAAALAARATGSASARDRRAGRRVAAPRLGAALRIAACCARGRHLVHLPGAVAIDGLRACWRGSSARRRRPGRSSTPSRRRAGPARRR